MNFQGVGVLPHGRVIAVSHAGDSNVTWAQYWAPTPGPETSPSVAELTCTRFVPSSPAFDGQPQRVTLGGILYASGLVVGRRSSKHVILKVADGEPVGSDFASVAEIEDAPADDGFCGASGVELERVVVGGFVAMRGSWNFG